MDAFPVSTDLLGKSASAYEHLRRSAARGHLRPNRRLSATGLADHFHISVTPVREALVRMAAEGFLDWEASRGHFTKRFTLKEQVDLHEFLGVNLAACLQRPQGAAPAALEEILGLVPGEGPEAADRTAAVIDALAHALVDWSGNAVLARVMGVMLDRTQLVRRLDLDTPDRIAAIGARISGLAAAALSHDPATAVAILGQHLAERRQRLPDLVDRANLILAQATYP